MIIDGKKTAEILRSEIKKEINFIKEQTNNCKFISNYNYVNEIYKE